MTFLADEEASLEVSFDDYYDYLAEGCAFMYAIEVEVEETNQNFVENDVFDLGADDLDIKVIVSTKTTMF